MMLTRPGLSDQTLIEVVEAGWGIASVTVEYRAVGFGGHHWRVIDSTGDSWFVTVDDLTTRLRSAEDSLDAAYDRLHAALATARAVGDGRAFVVAPVAKAADGDVLARIGARYSVAVYPYIDGRPHEFGQRLAASDRLAVLRLIVAVHASTDSVRAMAPVEEFGLTRRDALIGALEGLAERWDSGPYGERARSLLAGHARDGVRLLDRYDLLVTHAREQPERMVLTHGEPHPGNLIKTAIGWMLIDWDTTQIAPPERDLWILDPGDGSINDAYTRATGRQVRSSMLELYRLTWQLADIAIFVSRFRDEHHDTDDDRESWQALTDSLEHPWPSQI
jgi:spectinomycin phosphotransferase/16S rRNA (guanine(1405)-N(7))-methyltransferase